jgi:hypothetical protein
MNADKLIKMGINLRDKWSGDVKTICPKRKQKILLSALILIVVYGTVTIVVGVVLSINMCVLSPDPKHNIQESMSSLNAERFCGKR